MDVLRRHLLREGHIDKPEVMELVDRATKIMRKCLYLLTFEDEEPNVIRIKEPVIIVGDIHGQFYDLIHMFEKVVDQRKLPNSNILFLGDYVDRGNYSIEVCIFLFALKICFPKQVTLLRGNHESVAMTEHFTFREEVLRKYDNDKSVYEAFIESFESMPLAADVNGDYLCMHGGISPDLVTVEDINKIDRFVEPPLQGFLCDLLWSDPCTDKEARSARFTKNHERECSYKYGLEPVKQVLKKNNFLSIIRAHQVQIDGYKMHRWGGSQAFPSVITVFSAPNYCGSYKNKGAVILIENDKMNIKQYKDVEQPFMLPNSLDLFSWSLPFLADKIGDMMDHLLKKSTSVKVKEDDLAVVRRASDVDFSVIKQKLLDEKADEHERKIQRLKAKVMTVARFNRMLKNRKENSEILGKAKMISADGKLPLKLLTMASKDIKNDVQLFLEVRKIDS